MTCSNDKILATQKINYEDSTTTSFQAKPISVSIDAVRNNVTSSFSTSDAGSTQFAEGDDVLIDVITVPTVVDSFSNFGNLNLSFNTTKEITEFIIVVDEDEFSLQHFPISGFSAVFLGIHRGGSSVIVKGRKGIISAKAFGLLKVKYIVDVQVWRLNGGRDQSMMAFVNQDGSKSSVTVTFESPDPCDSKTVSNVIIIAKDNKTGDVVEGAVVEIDSATRGTTDIKGELNVGTLIKGRTYQIKIEKTGFQSTDTDCLENSSFTL